MLITRLYNCIYVTAEHQAIPVQNLTADIEKLLANDQYGFSEEFKVRLPDGVDMLPSLPIGNSRKISKMQPREFQFASQQTEEQIPEHCLL